jgi:hypothetical protein
MEISRRVWAGIGAGALAGVVVVGGLVLTQDGGSPPDVAVAASGDGSGDVVPGPGTGIGLEDPTTTIGLPIVPVTVVPPTSSTAPAPPTTTADRSTPGRRQIAASAGDATASGDASWTLFLTGDGGSRCLELETQGKTYRKLLCETSKAATNPIGDAVVVDVGSGRRAVVAVVQPRVTTLAWLYGDTARRTGPDPDRPGIQYGATITQSGTQPVDRPLEVVAYAGEDAVAAVDLPPAPGVTRESALKERTGKPYGTWPGYRRTATTGFYWAGNQEIGFYDGPNGTPCVLYRRLGGMAEGMMADACPAKDGSKPVPFATLIPSNKAAAPDQFHVLAVADVPIDSWTCTYGSSGPTTSTTVGNTNHPPGTTQSGGQGAGTSCGGGNDVIKADPKGTGRYAIGEFAGASSIPAGVDHVTLQFTGGGTTVATLDVPVPR